MRSRSDSGSFPRIAGRYVLGALAVAVALWAELFLARSPAATLGLTPFGLSIALTVWLGGLGPGLLALALASIALDYFIIDPGSLFRFSDSIGLVVWTTFTAAWLIFCLVTARVHRGTEENRRARRALEVAAAQSDRLAQLASALARARTPGDAIEAALQEPVHALRADAGIVLLVAQDGTTMDAVRSVGYPGHEREARLARAVDARSPARDAITGGAPVYIQSRDAYAVEYPDAMTPAPSFCSALAAVPMFLGNRAVCVVQLEFRDHRVFTLEDREYLGSLGLRGAEALERTWQLEAALRAKSEAESLRARADEELAGRQKMEQALRLSEARYRAFAARTSRLHGLAAALSEAVALDAVAHAVVRHGCNVLGATNGEVSLLVESGAAFETLYSDAHASESGQRFAAEPGLCATHAVATRTPIFIASFAEWQERYARSAAIAADGGYVSSATLPLVSDAAVIGVIAFYFTAPVNFDDEYQALLLSVAQHCAQALDRARLYESAQRARAEAETANQLKDDFVSIVSHELRTPLNAILGWTSMLQKGTLEPPMADRALQSVVDNATRQVRLVEELLDLSRLTSGRLALDVEDVDLRAVLRGVVESMIPAAAGSGLELDLTPIPALKVRGDARRIEQIFFNLIGNAVKFTPRGGRITISGNETAGFVEVRVSDTGPGIDPEFLPHMFERFRQADNTVGRQFGGVGLGLSIAKELVEAHRGTITAESAGPGTGSTFIVALPISPQPAAAESEAAVY